jgi:hypothetical protein
MPPTGRRSPSASCGSLRCVASLRPPLPSVRRCGRRRGRLWTNLVALHAQTREHGQWLSASELEQATRADGTPCIARVRALCQKVVANVEWPPELRRQELAETGHIQTQYPHHPKAFQTVVWKDQALPSFPLCSPASAHGRTATPPAAPAHSINQGTPASGRTDLAGGPLRVVPDGEHWRDAATSPACGNRWGGPGGGPCRCP